MYFMFLPSGGEWILIFVVFLMLFGADKVPEVVKGLGKGIREFKKATDEIKREFEDYTSDIKEEFIGEKKIIEKDILDIKKKINEDIDEVTIEKPS